MTTPEAIRDLVKRLEAFDNPQADPLYYEMSDTERKAVTGISQLCAESAAALEQLLAAVEEAELVIGKFSAITAMADHKRYSNNVVWVNLTDRDFDAARDWKHKHGTAGQ